MMWAGGMGVNGGRYIKFEGLGIRYNYTVYRLESKNTTEKINTNIYDKFYDAVINRKL